MTFATSKLLIGSEYTNQLNVKIKWVKVHFYCTVGSLRNGKILGNIFHTIHWDYSQDSVFLCKMINDDLCSKVSTIGLILSLHYADWQSTGR